MARAFISLGSNIHPEENTRKAIRELAREVPIEGISTVYRTEPVGRPEQPRYFNCVVAVETGLPPEALKLTILRRIERDLGRTRSGDRYAPRTIDLDLILYDDIVLENEELTLPDPLIMARPFLAIPLAELAPELTIPGSRIPLKQAVSGMSEGGMEALPEYTALIRKEICDEHRKGQGTCQRAADRNW